MTARTMRPKTMKSPTKVRRFRGFAVMDRPDGSLIWGTFRPDRASAWQVYKNWNPPAGEPLQGQLVALDIRVQPAE